MTSTLVFVCGPHCSGKTTILKILHEQNILCERGSEIGKDLYYERKLQTAKQGHNFEFEIAHKELARDHQFATYEGTIAIETWHPGNIAYAKIRNPEVVPQLIQCAKQSPFIKKAVGIWLRVPKDVIKQRTQTFKDESDWAADFYTKIDEQIEPILRELQLFERVHVVDANRPFDEVLQDVIRIVQSAKRLKELV